jgi:probable HAF family extracellular repeat protein
MIRVPGLWLIKHKEIDAHIVCFRELLFHCAPSLSCHAVSGSFLERWGTRAYGINDTSTIVGFYNGTDSAEHGFIYKNGQWASLQFPNATQSTELYGISNSNVIVGQGQAHGYMYNDGTFKEIAVPGSAETQVRAIAPGGLIAGMADLTHGFLASCH